MKVKAKIQALDPVRKQEAFPGLFSRSVIYPDKAWVSKVKEILVGEKGKETGKDKTFAGVTGNIQHCWN